jgi:hypothetical protein
MEHANTDVTHHAMAVRYLAAAEQSWATVEAEWAVDRPNSGKCRLAVARAGHQRKMAEVHARLAGVVR